MGMSKRCIFCLHENDTDAVVCSNCHAPIESDRRTPVVPSELAFIERRAERQPSNQAAAALALFVAGEKTAITVPPESRVILGRNTAEGDEGVVDLTPYRAHLLGVSRHHAALSVVDMDYYVEDLNSVNGTWLNEVRLAPNRAEVLQSGDVLRLGLLLMYVSEYA